MATGMQISGDLVAGNVGQDVSAGAGPAFTNATLTTPALGTPSAAVMTNATGTAASLTSGSVTTNANLTGHITSSGNAAILGAFTLAQLNTALSDATLLTSESTISSGTTALTNDTLTTVSTFTVTNGTFPIVAVSCQTDELIHIYPSHTLSAPPTGAMLWGLLKTAVANQYKLALHKDDVGGNKSIIWRIMESP